MASYQKVKNLSREEAAYIAGLVDGEGTLSLSHRHRNENRQALDLLEQIPPYLRTYKAKRARLVLDDYLRLTPRNGKYSVTQKKARAAFVTKFLPMNPRPATTLRLDALKLPPIGRVEANRPANSINKQKKSPRG